MSCEKYVLKGVDVDTNITILCFALYSVVISILPSFEICIKWKLDFPCVIWTFLFCPHVLGFSPIELMWTSKKKHSLDSVRRTLRPLLSISMGAAGCTQRMKRQNGRRDFIPNSWRQALKWRLLFILWFMMKANEFKMSQMFVWRSALNFLRLEGCLMSSNKGVGYNLREAWYWYCWAKTRLTLTLTVSISSALLCLTTPR